MFRTLIASTLLVGALTLPAAADGFDVRIVGGAPDGYGYQDAGQERRNDDGGRPRPGWDRGYDRPDRDWRLSPRQIARSLRYRGYYDIEIIRQRPDVAIVRASARGRDMIVVVDARSGDVLRQRPADGWGSGRGWQGGWGQDWRRW